MLKTMEQLRAADAWQKVKALYEARGNDGQADWNDKFASYAESLPATILMCGLGQAAATLLAAAGGKREDPHYKLYEYLESWLCRDDPQRAPYPRARNLMDAIIANDRDAYMRAQDEALAWLAWLKKFAQAYLKEPKGGGDR